MDLPQPCAAVRCHRPRATALAQGAQSGLGDRGALFPLAAHAIPNGTDALWVWERPLAAVEAMLKAQKGTP